MAHERRIFSVCDEFIEQGPLPCLNFLSGFTLGETDIF